jgi:hypothetical protein
MSEPVQKLFGAPAVANDGFDWIFNDTVSGEQVQFYGTNILAGDVQSTRAFRSGLAFGIAATAVVAFLQTWGTLLLERKRNDGDNSVIT